MNPNQKTNDMAQKERINPLHIFTAAVILLCISFYNGYPLVYSDTGTYLYSGFEKFIPNDRPIYYGLFVKLFSFKTSLWFTVIVQNLIMAIALFEFFKLLPVRQNNQTFIISTILLTLISPLGWYSNQIMPDFFAPVIALLVFVILFAKKLQTWKFIAYSVLIIYGTMVHLSHLLLATGFAVFILLLPILSKALKTDRILPYSKRSNLILAGVLLSAWITSPVCNYMIESEFKYSKSGHVFMAAHLNDKGLLKKILNENCHAEEFANNKLCNQKDSLPTDINGFIWQGDFFEKTGGWENSKDDYNAVIKKSLTSPKYLLINATKSIQYAVTQLMYINVGEGLTAYGDGSAPYGQIAWHFPTELNNYLNSKQNKWNGDRLSFELLTIVFWVALILAACFFIVLKSHDKKRYATALTFIILAIILNSMATAMLTSPYERYQSRMAWLPLLLAIPMIFNKVEFYLKSIKNLLLSVKNK